MNMPGDNPPSWPPGADIPLRIERDAGLPRTERDAGPPRTERDAGPPRTERDAGPPRTERDAERAAGYGSGYARVNLPPRLDEIYVRERDLGSGGEADLVLARHRASGSLVVVRLYRRPDAPVDPDLLDRLKNANREHFIALLDWDRDKTATWEILEYAEHGSLGDLIRQRPGPWHDQQAAQVLDQLSAALDYAHSLDLVHRDIKPENVLVRSVRPLDVVLSDFGLARVLAQTRYQGTTSRTSAYASPDAMQGTASRAGDWWSLGIMMVELLTGSNPFQRPDGSWLDDRVIATSVATEDIDLSEISDERWRLLCRGLLIRSPGRRWGSRQVAEWRAGGQPEVHAEEARSTGRSATFVFARTAYTEPAKLAVAFRQDWAEARRLIAGQQAGSPQFLALRDWIARLPGDTVRLLERPSPPERLLAQLILALDPASPADFRGRDITPAGLLTLAGNAASENMAGPATDLLDTIYRDGILTVYDDVTGCGGYALLDYRWHRLVQALEDRFASCRVGTLDETESRAARIALLMAALVPDQEDVLAKQAALALADSEAAWQRWFSELGRERFDADLESARYQLIVMTRNRAAEQTASARLTEQQRAAAAERMRKAEVRGRIDRVSPVLGILAMLIGLGPVAVYFGIRARRTQSGCLSSLSLYLGLLETAAIVIGIIQAAKPH